MAVICLIATQLSSSDAEGATSSPYWIEDVNVTESPVFETYPILGTDAYGTLYLACNMLPEVGAKQVVQLRSSDDGGRTWDTLFQTGIEGHHLVIEDMYVNYMGGAVLVCQSDMGVLALTYPYGGMHLIAGGAAFYEAAVVVEPNGEIAHCVISQWDGFGGMDLLHSYAAKPWDSWSAPVTIAGGDPADHLTYDSPSLALGGHPEDLFLAYALSPSTHVHDIYVLNRTSSGWEPGPGKPLATSASDEYAPSITVFNGDQVVVAWTKEYGLNDHDVWTAHSPDYGDSYVAVPVWSSTRMERYPSLNRYFVEWSMAYLDEDAVYLSMYQGSGSWSAPQLISDDDAEAQPVAPSVSSYVYPHYSYYAPTPMFAVAVVWEDIRIIGNGEIRCTTYRYVRVSASASQMLIDATQSIHFTSEVICGTPPFTYVWSFDDGGSSTEPNPSHLFDVPGTYTVSVQVTDSWGQTSSHSIYGIQVNPALQVSGTSNPNVLDQHQTVWFTCTATDGSPPYSYLWDFGDGSFSDVTSPVHDYEVPGSYHPNVTVIDSVGMVVVWTSPLIQVNPLPAFTIGATPTQGIVPFEVAYTCYPENGTPPYTFEWDFGDGGTSSDQNPHHTYNRESEFAATLIMTDHVGTTVTQIGPVILAYSPLSLLASADKGVISVMGSVTFNCTASGGLPPYHFLWDFGDGGWSGEADVEHTFAQDGEFIVRLDVWDSLEPNSTANWTALVEVMALPHLVGEVDRTELNVLQPVQFTCSVLNGTPPFSYLWDFDDGNTSDQASVVHSYSSPGEYSPVLTINDSLGTVAVWTSPTIKVNPLPQASISASVHYGLSPLTVEFECSVLGGTSPYEFSWEFGDGGSASGNLTEHVYQDAGERLVTVTVFDYTRSQTYASFQVNVYAPFAIDASASSTSAEIEQEVRFNCTVSGALPPYTYHWDFGDGNGSDLWNASHDYERPGLYPVALSVRDANEPALEAELLVVLLRVDLPFDPPSAPRDLVAVAGKENVTLSWGEPLFSNASAVVGYVISYGPSPTSLPYQITWNQPSYVVDGLTKGQTCYFMVAAQNNAGWGLNSALASAIPFGVPDPPTGLHAVPGDGGVALDWTAPPTYIGPGTITYRLFRDHIPIWSGVATFHTDAGLINGQEYAYQVSAGNSVGWSQNTTSIYVTPLSPPLPPGAPAGLQISVGDGLLTLNWTAPPEPGSSPITGYMIYRGTVSGSLTFLANVTGINYTDSTVTNGQSYIYRVSAFSSAGEGALSEEAEGEAEEDDGIPPGVLIDQWPLLILAGVTGMAIVAIGAMAVREVRRRAARKEEGYVDCPRCGAEVPPQAHNCPKCNAHIRGPR